MSEPIQHGAAVIAAAVDDREQVSNPERHAFLAGLELQLTPLRNYLENAPDTLDGDPARVVGALKWLL